MIKGNKADFIEIIKELEKSLVEFSKLEAGILERIQGYHERMARFGAEDYYEKQIAQEEELLSQVRKINDSRKAFLEELKKSYSEQNRD
ncbi:hypothetical protein BCV73_24200 [Paenibacillus sp. SSG-1]|uniref:hypothetical protein n=1 Tax=Paenibacillus sp. SSG-1 TaxID=1443669 RepID=UPI000B7F8666|nr:hypothetical protein [Paenibacillus sp. SSG-1]OXL85832.1 hypothetical protein BCV73_24200 [Paenibacillus sp. SSG-1]